MRSCKRQIGKPRLGSELRSVVPFFQIVKKLRCERRGGVETVGFDWEIRWTEDERFSTIQISRITVPKPYMSIRSESRTYRSFLL